MKSKLKAPEIAKKKGFDFVKGSLKKYLKEEIIEPSSFLYDSEFSYDGTPEKMPVMFIGEVPSLWKKYVKQNKASKTLAAGRCTFKEGMLSLEVKVGKGGKNPVLKSIQKLLLKPFAKVQFVESLDNALVAEDSESSDTQNEELDEYSIEELLTEAKSLADETRTQENILSNHVSNLGATVTNLGITPISDDLISKAKVALKETASLDTNNLLSTIELWLKNFSKEIAENVDLSKEVDVLLEWQAKLKVKNIEMQKISIECKKMEKVQNPKDYEVTPVSTDVFTVLLNGLLKASK